MDGLIEHEHRRHPKLMRKGGLRHHVVKQVVQRGVAGLVGGIIEEGLTSRGEEKIGIGKEEEHEPKGRNGRNKKESVKRVVKGAVRDYERWEKGGEGGGGGKEEEREGKNERERRERGGREGQRERDIDDEEGSQRRRERTRERERRREGSSVRGRRR